MKNILFTFDYELFLGSKSGTVQNCLIKPTDCLRVLLKQYSCKAVFFIDTTYLIELEKKAAQYAPARKDLDLILAQLSELSKDGHDLFPHLHPHWLDAVYDPATNEWNLANAGRYRFHVLNEAEREAVFSDSIRILAGILKQFNHPRPDLGYRAGGWCLQPFDAFKPFFERFDIRYDFSVLKGAYCNSDIRYFDFRNLKDERDIFRFSENVARPESGGPFTEFCITRLRPLSVFENYLARIVYKLLPAPFKKSFGDGLSAVLKEKDISGETLPDIPEPGVMASVELLDAVNLRHHFNYLRHRNFLQFIGHPKMISRYNLKMLEIFLKRLCSKYKVETDFRKIAVLEEADRLEFD